MPLTEKAISRVFRDSQEQYRPLRFTELKKEVWLASGHILDAIVNIDGPGGKSIRAIVEYTAVATPKNTQLKIHQLLSLHKAVGKKSDIPLLVAPYIGEQQAKMLEDAGVSWLDLSGNMRIVGRGLYVERTGNKNQYPDNTPSKRIFEGTSSLVSRALLANPAGFSSQQEIVEFINQRNGSITPPTVSKVLRSLEEGLLIEKGGEICVRDKMKLATALVAGYRKTVLHGDGLYEFDVEHRSDVLKLLAKRKVEYAVRGVTAAALRGFTQPEDGIEIFAKNLTDIEGALKPAINTNQKNPRCKKLSVIETDNPAAFFNTSICGRITVIDDVGIYLEMTACNEPNSLDIARQVWVHALEV